MTNFRDFPPKIDTSNFRVLSRGSSSAGRSKYEKYDNQLYIFIGKNGLITFSKAADAAIGKAKFVKFLYDNSGLLMISPCDESDLNRYAVDRNVYYKKVRKENSFDGRASFTAKYIICQTLHIENEKAHAYLAIPHGNSLIIDLKQRASIA